MKKILLLNLLFIGSLFSQDYYYVSIKNFIQLLKCHDYQIRLDDQRVGYFLTQVDNLS